MKNLNNRVNNRKNYFTHHKKKNYYFLAMSRSVFCNAKYFQCFSITMAKYIFLFTYYTTVNDKVINFTVNFDEHVA